MKKINSILLVLTIIFIAGCSNNGQKPPEQSTQNSTQGMQINHPVKIVTSFYPLYEIANKIGGNQVTIKNLVPAGAEPHDYEASPQDVIAINQADLLIVNGFGLEPWVEGIKPDLEQKGLKIIDMSDLFKDIAIKNGPKSSEDEEYLPYDPHLWLDPFNYSLEVKAVQQKLMEIDPQNWQTYDQNGKSFLAQLSQLDKEYSNGLKACKLQTYVTNHAAFGYLSQRYALEMLPIGGLSPDSEPSPKTMAELVNVIKSKNIHYVLTESLVSPKVAETVAQETGAKILVLNPLEGLTPQEIAAGKDYLFVMRENLKTLQTALECD